VRNACEPQRVEGKVLKPTPKITLQERRQETGNLTPDLLERKEGKRRQEVSKKEERRGGKVS